MGRGLAAHGKQDFEGSTVVHYVFIVSFVALVIMKKLMNGLRVTEEEELVGLDLSEHGSYGYPEAFVVKEQRIAK